MPKYAEKSTPNIQILALAVRAAKSCAIAIEQCHGPTLFGLKSSQTDPVTTADIVGERAIVELIKRERPQDGFLGEEGNKCNSSSGLRWVIDPIDGTANYLYKIPHWAISIGCEKDINGSWQTIVGVVYDVMRKEIFTTIRGSGAYMNNNLIYVNNLNNLNSALIATEFSYKSSSRTLQSQVLTKILPIVRDIRSSGSSVLDLCWVAAGRFDGFYEEELEPWDRSAASLIIEEAGGLVSSFGTGVIAGSASIHNALCSLLHVH
jgi:myo-inositol-1(or 4)-monophosphatase